MHFCACWSLSWEKMGAVGDFTESQAISACDLPFAHCYLAKERIGIPVIKVQYFCFQIIFL